MTKEKIKESLSKVKESKNADDEIRKKVETAKEILEQVPENDFMLFKSIKPFMKKVEVCADHPSVTDDYNYELDNLITELLDWKKDTQEEVKSSVICLRRKSKKGTIVAGFLITLVGAIVAVVCGALSIAGIVSGAVCDMIGVLDCAFGLLFFGYELWDDKVSEGKINSGDFDSIKKAVGKIVVNNEDIKADIGIDSIINIIKVGKLKGGIKVQSLKTGDIKADKVGDGNCINTGNQMINALNNNASNIIEEKLKKLFKI